MPLLRPLLITIALTLLLALAGAGAGDAGVSAASAASTRSAAGAPVADPARRWPVGGVALRTALRLAEAQWGGAACGGRVAISWTPLAEGVNATATWSNPAHAWDNAMENFDCRIELNPGAEFDWRKVCTIVAHEVGHLHGRRHDASNLMGPVYRRPLATCAATPEPGVRRSPRRAGAARR